MKSSRLFSLLVVAMALFAVQAANATSITYNCTVISGTSGSSTVSCPYFDASLGTLTSATLALTGGSITFDDVISATSGDLNYSLSSLTGKLTYTTTGISAIASSLGMSNITGIAMNPNSTGGIQTLAGGSSTTFTSNSDNVTHTYTASSLSPFVGTGNFSFNVDGSIAASSYFDNSSSEVRTYTLTDTWTITYVYDSTAAPEPTTVGMALCGLVLVLFGVRRSRGIQ